jgi:hypothetical protein
MNSRDAGKYASVLWTRRARTNCSADRHQSCVIRTRNGRHARHIDSPHRSGRSEPEVLLETRDWTWDSQVRERRRGVVGVKIDRKAVRKSIWYYSAQPVRVTHTGRTRLPRQAAGALNDPRRTVKRRRRG